MTTRSKNVIHFLAILGVLFCVLLDGYCTWGLASSPAFGAQITSLGSACIIDNIYPQSYMQQQGVNVGDTLISALGRPVDANACRLDPESSPSWADRQLLVNWNTGLFQAGAQGQIPVEIRSRGTTHAFLIPTHPLGWRQAWKRTWIFRIVGWSFFLVSWLILRKKINETTIINYLGGVAILGSMSTLAASTTRDIALSAQAFQWINGWGCFFSVSAVITLYLGWIFPTPMVWIRKYPWFRILPWAAFVIDISCHYLHVFSAPYLTAYVLAGLALPGYMLTLVYRLWTETDPQIKPQLFWIVLGGLGGFLPWTLFSALPAGFDYPFIPHQYTLLFAILTPICLSFAIFRYRLLDVGHIFDLVIVHSTTILLLSILELAVINWAINSLQADPYSMPTLITASMMLFVFLYAPFRNWLTRKISRFAGVQLPPIAEALQSLLLRTQANRNPIEALEETLEWALRPSSLLWALPGQGFDLALEMIAAKPEGCLGVDLGNLCPTHLGAAAWVPIHTTQGSAAILLQPSRPRGWNRNDMRFALTLVRATEPLVAAEKANHAHTELLADMQEQRDEIIREMHDGLGSQLFGLSLLSRAGSTADEPTLRQRLLEISSTSKTALETLQSGISILAVPKGLIAPSLHNLTNSIEPILHSIGASLEVRWDRRIDQVELNTQCSYNLLRALQECLNNVTKHSKANKVFIHIFMTPQIINAKIQDNGIGFDLCSVTRGHGLTSIEKRMAKCQGKVSIISTPDTGTTIHLELPFAE